MGHAGMAATAVRYLRSVGAATSAGPAAPVEALPRPDLRAVADDERLPVDPGEFRRVPGHFASGVTVVTASDADGPAGFACQSFAQVRGGAPRPRTRDRVTAPGLRTGLDRLPDPGRAPGWQPPDRGGRVMALGAAEGTGPLLFHRGRFGGFSG